jgi:serine/threonine-protein kinase
VKGKISYLSPEQCRGKRVDRRSDLFSLGICFWEMLTTERLYRRASDFENMNAIVSEPPPPPSSRRADVPAELDALVLRMLAKDPDDRCQTAEEVVEAVEAISTRTGSVLSASALGRFVRELFGQRPEPWLELESLQEHGEAVTVTSEPIPHELAIPPADRIDHQLASVLDLSAPRQITESLDPVQLQPEVPTAELGKPAKRGFPLAAPPPTHPGISVATAPESQSTAPRPTGPSPAVPAPVADSFTPSSGIALPAPPTSPGPGLAPAASAAGMPAVAGSPSSLSPARSPGPSPASLPASLPARSPAQGAIAAPAASGAFAAVPPASPSASFSASFSAQGAIAVAAASGAFAAVPPASSSASSSPASSSPASSSPASSSPASSSPASSSSASFAAAAVPPGAASGSFAGSSLGSSPASSSSASFAAAAVPPGAASGSFAAPAVVSGAATPDRAGPRRAGWPLYAVIAGAAVVGSVAMVLLMRSGADRGGAATSRPSPVAAPAGAPVATTDAPARAADRITVEPIEPEAAARPAARPQDPEAGGSGTASAVPGAQDPIEIVEPGPSAPAPRAGSAAGAPRSGSPPPAGSAAATRAAAPRAPRGSPASPAGHAPDPRERGEEIARLYSDGHYDQVVAQCGRGQIAAERAPLCFLAACHVGDEAAARRLIAGVPPVRRDQLTTNCKQLGVDVRRTDCEADPMLCQH